MYKLFKNRNDDIFGNVRMKEGDEGKVNKVRQRVFLHICTPTPSE